MAFLFKTNKYFDIIDSLIAILRVNALSPEIHLVNLGLSLASP